jgi:uncharacterized membrane protein
MAAARSEAVAWYDLRRAQARLWLALALGCIAALALRERLDLSMCAIAAWDAGALALLLASWWIILRGDAEETRRRAAAEDPGRRTLLGVALVSSTVSLFASAMLVRHADGSDMARQLAIALCLAAPVIAWLLTHSVYTLHYAHLYYGSGAERGGGLAFPDTKSPDDLDFAYFAFTVGMCFQVSDVAVHSSHFRRVVLGHSLLSFVFNTAVLALALNVALGSLKPA